jgi:FG-GAP-like repeat
LRRCLPLYPGACEQTPFVEGGDGTVTEFALGSVAIADVNGDSTPDIIVTNACGAESNCVTGSVGNGDGTFQAAISYSSGGDLPGDLADSIAIADVNVDGSPDLLVANFDNSIGVLLNNTHSIQLHRSSHFLLILRRCRHRTENSSP